MPLSSDTNSIEVFVGATSEVEAHVYVSCEGLGTGDGQWSAWVEGPFCEYSKTLPARVQLRPEGGERPELLGAVVPDPCFWTSELPFLYKVSVTTQDGHGAPDSIERLVGIKPFRYRGSDLFYAGRRHVVRAVDVAVIERGVQEIDPFVAECREIGSALFTARVDDRLGERASRQGLMLITRIDADDAESVRHTLRRLARWPAVAIAVIKSGVTLPADLGRCAPNLLLACEVDDIEAAMVPQWANVLIIDAERFADGAQWSTTFSLPMMAIKRVTPIENISDGRRKCDELQRELAPVVDLAGYIVSCQPDGSPQSHGGH